MYQSWLAFFDVRFQRILVDHGRSHAFPGHTESGCIGGDPDRVFKRVPFIQVDGQRADKCVSGAGVVYGGEAGSCKVLLAVSGFQKTSFFAEGNDDG